MKDKKLVIILASLFLTLTVNAYAQLTPSGKWSYDRGYSIGNFYCKPGGYDTGIKHARYWTRKGRNEYAQGIRARLSWCTVNGKFTPPKKVSKLNNRICFQTGLKEYWPSIYNFQKCAELKNDDDLSKP